MPACVIVWSNFATGWQAQQRAWRVPLKLSPEEITSVLRSQIEEYEAEVDVEEVGIVLEVGDGIARIHGLRNAVSLEMLELPHAVMGLVLNLEENNVGVVLLGEDTLIKEGDLVKPVSYTHLRAHETKANIVCRLLLEK